MSIKVLHIVGGSSTNGAAKGASILHEALIKLKVNSHLLNDSTPKNFTFGKNASTINKTFFTNIMYKFYVNIEKLLKLLFLHSPRETFTIGLFGFDITKLKQYKNADIIHIHWLSQGFIRIGSLSKIKKPVIWTMRDMWAFTGGSHYTMDFNKYEESKLSKIIQNIKKKNYKKNFHFVAVSDWLKDKGQNSYVLENFNVKRIYNNIDVKNFLSISKNDSKLALGIETKKRIILYGANNPQSKRKGWNIFVEALKKIDKSKYFLLIFGNFWSQETLNKIGIEFKSFGFISDYKKLNLIYSCADFFVASSIQDAWPKTFAEAMYCNTPVICFKNTSIAEIVDHKINGYVVEDFDPVKLKKGIEWMSNQIENNKIRENVTKDKIKNFGSTEIAKKYIELYQKVISEK